MRGQRDELPQIKLPNYEFVSELGRGGMAKVYLARQLNPDRAVAIKIISPDDGLPPSLMEALKQEGNTAAQFDHDNLLHVYDCGVVDGHYYMAMQYLPGGDLEERLRKGLSTTETVEIISQIASALGHVHERGLVHRDVKPANILFAASGKPVLADFGIAKSAQAVGPFTSAGYSCGTPAYMSPEQVIGSELGPQSDLYALGIVLYECLTGEKPFAGDSAHEVKEAQVSNPPPDLPRHLANMQSILDRLLAKRPTDRYTSAREVVEDLQRVNAQSPHLQATKFPPKGPVRGRQPALFAWAEEMQNRHVFKVVAAYLILGWGFTEVINTVADRLHVVPGWIPTAATIAFMVGIPITVLLAWVFDLDRTGVRRTPTHRSGLLIVSVALASLISLTWLGFEYIGVEHPAVAEQSPEAEAASSAPVLAVMPVSTTLSQADAAVGDSIVEDIVDALGAVPGLRVKAAGATAMLLQSGDDLGSIVQTLNLSHLVVPSLELEGVNLALRVRLLDATQNQLWATEYVDDLSRVEQLARKIARDIGAELNVGQAIDSAEQAKTVDPRAYALLAQAKTKGNSGDSDKAIELAKRALQIEPDYAEAHSVLASFYVFNGWMSGDRNHPHLDLAHVQLQLAQALEPDLPEPYAIRAVLEHWRLDWNRALEAAQRYLASGDTDMLAQVSMALNAMGYAQEASEVALDALQADPVSPLNHLQVCVFALNAGRLDVALESCEYLELIGFNDYWVVYSLGYLLKEQGVPEEEIRARLLALAPDAARRIEAILNPESRPGYLEELRAGDIPVGDLAAETYLFGTAEEAEAIAREQLQRNQFNAVVYFFRPQNPLRARPAFLELMDGNGLREFWLEHRPPDFCRKLDGQLHCS